MIIGKNTGRPVPERLIDARKKAGLSVMDAAECLHLTRVGVNKYETGQTRPTWPVLRMLAFTYHTSVEWLCGETDDPSPDRVVIDADDSLTGDLLVVFGKLDEDDRNGIVKLAKRLAGCHPQDSSID